MISDQSQAFLGWLVQIEIEICKRNNGLRVLAQVVLKSHRRVSDDEFVFPNMTQGRLIFMVGQHRVQVTRIPLRHRVPPNGRDPITPVLRRDGWEPAMYQSQRFCGCELKGSYMPRNEENNARVLSPPHSEFDDDSGMSRIFWYNSFMYTMRECLPVQKQPEVRQ